MTTNSQEVIYTSPAIRIYWTVVKDKSRLLKLAEEGRKQPGVEFPAPSDQPHVLVIRANLSHQVRFGSAEPDVHIGTSRTETSVWTFRAN